MSHELETVNGRVSFAYNINGGNPWHRLGTPLDGLQGLDEMLEASQADYTVEALPLTAMGIEGIQGIDSHFATGRRNPHGDSDDVYDVLGVVTKGYQIIQNRDAAQFALDIVNAGEQPVIDTMGVMFEGRRFFTYIRLDDLDLGGEDVIARGLGLVTSHDGTLSLTVALSNVRWVCNNTVTAGLSTAARSFKIKHTASADDRMVQARQALGLISDQQAEFERRVRRLRVESFARYEFERLVRQVWPRDDDESKRAKSIRDRRESELSALWAQPQNLGVCGATKWGAYNTVVEYLDHHRSGISGQRRLEACVDPDGVRQKDEVYRRLVGVS